MQSKIMKRVLVAAMLGAAVGLAGADPAFAQTNEAKIAIVAPDADNLGQAMHTMADYIRRSFPGKFKVDVYAGSTLFTQTQQIPAMQRGNLEFGLVTMFDIVPFIPEASIMTAGYLIRDVDHHCSALKTDWGKKVLAQVEEKMNIKIIGQVLVGFRTLMLRKKKDVKIPADIANLTMREVPNEAWQFLAEALGAKPTPIAFSELYLALQTGTVDAFAGYATALKSTKFHEVTEQVVLTNHLVGVDLIGVSTRFWNSLTPHEKAVVMEAGDVASTFSVKNRVRAEENAIEELTKELKMTVTTPNVEAFRKYMKEKYLASKFAKAWPDGLWDMIEKTPSIPNCKMT